MAVPTYTADLTTITAADALGTFVEPSTWTGGGVPALETDYFLQGTACVSKPFTTGTPPLLGGSIYDNAAGITVPTDGAVFFWWYYQCPNAIDTEVNGGARLLIGSGQGAFNAWKIRGKDTYVYGGWLCLPVNPTLAVDYTVGAPTATLQWFGIACNVLATSKGSALGVDAIRYGRGEMKIEFGAVADGFGTFSGAASYNDGTSNRFGLVQAIDGGYLYQGLLLLGSAANAVDFRDSNVNVVIPVTKKVTANFNTIEVRNAASRVDWTNVVIKSLSTVSRGRFVVTDNADVNLSLCQFTDMGTFSFLAATDALNCVFRNCDQITAPGSNLSGSEVRGYIGAADTSAVVWNVATDPDGRLNDTIFEKGTNAHHAIEFGTTSPTTMTLRRVTLTGFNAANGATDSALHIKRTAGTVTINIVGGTSPSYKTDGATVSIVINPVSMTVTVKDVVTGAVIQNARVLVLASDGTGPLPYNVTVTISRVGATATVAHTAHGLATNDKVQIKGADQVEYNGVFSITFINANSYSYTVSGAPATPATGAIKATGVSAEGLTDVNGIVSATRSYGSNQPITGRVRKSTATPFYKTAPITGTIDSVNGFSVTIQMIPDE